MVEYRPDELLQSAVEQRPGKLWRWMYEGLAMPWRRDLFDRQDEQSVGVNMMVVGAEMEQLLATAAMVWDHGKVV